MRPLKHFLAVCVFAQVALFALPALAGALAAPDDALTPGALRTGALHAKRPPLPSAVVEDVARRYGVTLGPKDRLGVHDASCGTGKGQRCEIDHRIPWGCGGASVAENLWYQDAADYPRKDRLEHWFERQVTLGRLSAAECQEAFRAPNRWQDRYRVVFGAEP